MRDWYLEEAEAARRVHWRDDFFFAVSAIFIGCVVGGAVVACLVPMLQR